MGWGVVEFLRVGKWTLTEQTPALRSRLARGEVCNAPLSWRSTSHCPDSSWNAVPARQAPGVSARERVRVVMSSKVRVCPGAVYIACVKRRPWEGVQSSACTHRVSEISDCGQHRSVAAYPECGLLVAFPSFDFCPGAAAHQF